MDPVPSDNDCRSALFFATLIVTLLTPPTFAEPTAASDPASPRSLAALSPGRTYVEADGASLYANTCQGCHMRDGWGATGAATYPSLVANADLRSADFAVEVVVKGLRGMPPVGRSMSDDQVAAVVNYVRSHFENTADSAVTVSDVRTIRAQDDN